MDLLHGNLRQCRLRGDQNRKGDPAALVTLWYGRHELTVACVGGSAGGLDAYQRIIRGIPADAGMAIVVINHMRRCVQVRLPEILSKEASMPVQLLTEGMLLERNHVYVEGRPSCPEFCLVWMRTGLTRWQTIESAG